MDETVLHASVQYGFTHFSLHPRLALQGTKTSARPPPAPQQPLRKWTRAQVKALRSYQVHA